MADIKSNFSIKKQAIFEIQDGKKKIDGKSKEEKK